MVKLAVTCFCLQGKKAKNAKADSLRNANFVRFDFATILSASSNFSDLNMIGQGGFGAVYKGTLESGKVVAIKRLRHDLDLSSEVFITESRVVARVQHTNLVKHLGFCSEGKEKILVYEFLPNASLARLLFDPSRRAQINWRTWYNIILGIANGLAYLHGGNHGRILHCGLKTSNVLLDEDMIPKIADFAMNKLFNSAQEHTNTCCTVATESTIATYVYIAPEYMCTGRYSSKSDVYSFGVIVLETVIYLKNEKSSQSTITYAHLDQARRLWEEDRLSEMINPALSVNCSETDVIMCIQVGILCIQKDADHRPTMTEAILMLTGKVAVPRPSAPLNDRGW